MADANMTPAAPATIVQDVLVNDFGHSLYRAVLRDGSLGAWLLVANPEDCGKHGEIPEAHWAAAEAAAAKPVHGCADRREWLRAKLAEKWAADRGITLGTGF